MRTALALIVVSILLVAPGCGDDEDGAETGTVEQTVTSEEGTTTEAAETPAPAPTGDTGPGRFVTPSKNIGCIIDAGGARCDISQREWKPTPEPASCRKTGVDYGQGITVDAAHAEFVCAGDTVLGAGETLAYGETAARGDFVCESEQQGVTCSHPGNGHGFFLSRGSFRIF